MNCILCGQPLIPGESQCRNCGRFVNTQAPAQGAAPVIPQTNVQPQAPVQQPVQPQVNVQPQTPQPGNYAPQGVQAGAARPAQPQTPQPGNYAPQGVQAGAARPAQPQTPQHGNYAPQGVQAGAARPVQPQSPYAPQGAQAGAARPVQPQSPYAPQGAAARPAGQPAMRPPVQQAYGGGGRPPVPPQAARSAQPPKGGKGKMIALIIAAIVLVVGGIVATILILNNKDKDKKTDRAGRPGGTTVAVTSVTTEATTTAPTTTEYTTEYTTVSTETSTEQTTTQQVNGSKTIMMYIIGSDLETKWGEATLDIQEILDANLGSNVNFIIQTGGSQNWQNDKMIDGECQRFKVEGTNLVELQQLGKMSMVDPNNLTDFITFAKQNYPADTYMLVLWDHGGGIPIGYGLDEMFPNQMMWASDIGYAIKNSGVHFESLLFDACNVCTLEAAVAVKDSVDYMVAAESYVNGTGYYYTDWLKMYETCSIGDLDYTEQICRDYMKVIHQYDMTGSISVLEMDKITEVYDAYKNYIGSLSDTVINGNDYVAYTQARSNCISYEYTDTIDIITLASQYNNNYSTKLINSIVNSVSYTESDFAAGHGIAVYSPFEYIEYYSDARTMMEYLGYDAAILGFYDSYCSLKAAYQGGGTTTTEDWYDDETVNDTVSEDDVASEYTLTTSTNSSGQIIVDVPEDLWETYQTIEMGVVLMSEDGNQGLMLGTDYYELYDDNNNLLVDKPDSWAYVNGYAASYVCLSAYDDPNDPNKWDMYGTIFAQVNGVDSLILVYYSNDYPSGIVQGYANVDYNNISAASESDFYQFQDTDTIDLVYPIFDGSGAGTYTANGEPFTYADLQLSYEPIDLTGYATIVWYTITDVYGNVYETEGDVVE
ncbi:MAG: hypothetical protein IJJ74_10840 [Eubacterium sp.]|nr:hypothetical protein [Eubacterium sp.]